MVQQHTVDCTLLTLSINLQQTIKISTENKELNPVKVTLSASFKVYNGLIAQDHIYKLSLTETRKLLP